jgi:hypothetical protein
MFFGEICDSIRGKIDCRPKNQAKSDRLLGRIIQENRAFYHIPVRQVIEATFGPLASYCSKQKHRFTNQENAPYFAYSAALGLWPNASAIGLAELATTARVLMVGFIAFAMIVLGFGGFWAFVSILLGLELHVILIETHVLSNYPFMTLQLAVRADWLLSAIRPVRNTDGQRRCALDTAPLSG